MKLTSLEKGQIVGKRCDAVGVGRVSPGANPIKRSFTFFQRLKNLTRTVSNVGMFVSPS